jgi:hypothetical protein
MSCPVFRARAPNAEAGHRQPFAGRLYTSALALAYVMRCAAEDAPCALMRVRLGLLAIVASTNTQGENSMPTPFRVITLLLVLHAGGCASPQSSKALVKVPDKLKPGANESLNVVVPARGADLRVPRQERPAQCIRMGVRGSRSRPFRHTWKQNRPALWGAALGIDRWEQDRGYVEGTCRRARGRCNPLAASCREVRWLGGFVQQDKKHTTREYRGRRGTPGWLFTSCHPCNGPHQLHGGLLLLRRQVGRSANE